MKRLLIGLVVVLLVVAVASAVVAQGIAAQQQWEYVLMLVDLDKSEYTFVSSQLYESDYEVTTNFWEALDSLENAVLVDYLSVMGLSAFELVSVEQVGGDFLYSISFFRRPVITRQEDRFN
jgi:hypothetical protein